MNDENLTLRVTGLSKSFPGVKALDKAELEIYPGEVHVVMGENGAGKSTLMKILAGVYTADEGEIYLSGELTQINGTLDLSGTQCGTQPDSGRKYFHGQ
jgi:ABC-type sugar transport system ATPase subunit